MVGIDTYTRPDTARRLLGAGAFEIDSSSSSASSLSLSAARLFPPVNLPRALAERVLIKGTSSGSEVAGVSGSSATDSGLELKMGDTLESGVVSDDREDDVRAD
jgi:hypothetical protein